MTSSPSQKPLTDSGTILTPPWSELTQMRQMWVRWLKSMSLQMTMLIYLSVTLYLFYLPIAIPTGKGTQGQYGIQCKFGRFGVGQGSYVNKTTLKCLTPSVSDDPDSIWRETVKITVALNGQDFDEDNSDVEFTFVGTGSTLVFWPYIVSTLLIGLLLVGIIMFCSAILQKISFEKMMPSAPSFGGQSNQAQSSNQSLRLRNRPYVIRDPYDQFTSRAYVQGVMGRQSAAGNN